MRITHQIKCAFWQNGHHVYIDQLYFINIIGAFRCHDSILVHYMWIKHRGLYMKMVRNFFFLVWYYSRTKRFLRAADDDGVITHAYAMNIYIYIHKMNANVAGFNCGRRCEIILYCPFLTILQQKNVFIELLHSVYNVVYGLLNNDFEMVRL